MYYRRCWVAWAALLSIASTIHSLIDRSNVVVLSDLSKPTLRVPRRTLALLYIESGAGLNNVMHAGDGIMRRLDLVWSRFLRFQSVRLREAMKFSRYLLAIALFHWVDEQQAVSASSS